MRREYLDRQERLYQQKQSIRVDVLGARVNLLQADANRWTAWYNLQLARLDMLRATELLLDYVEKAGITHLPTEPRGPAAGLLEAPAGLADPEQARRACSPRTRRRQTMERLRVNRRWLPLWAAMMALPAVEVRAEEPTLPRPVLPQSPMAASSGQAGRPAWATLQPGAAVTLRIRQVFPCDGFSPGERLLNGRQPIQPGDRFLAEVIKPPANPPPLVALVSTQPKFF